MDETAEKIARLQAEARTRQIGLSTSQISPYSTLLGLGWLDHTCLRPDVSPVLCSYLLRC